MQTSLSFTLLLVLLLGCSAPATREATTDVDAAAEPSSSDGGASDVADGSVGSKARTQRDAGPSSVTLPAHADAGHAPDAGSRDAAPPAVDAGTRDAAPPAVDAGTRDAAPAVDAGESDGSVVPDAAVDAGPMLPACAGAIAASLCLPASQCPARVICSDGGGYGCCDPSSVAPFCKCD
jgi:hypothetical protein